VLRKHFMRCIAAALPALACAPAVADPYSDARAELLAAYEAENFVAMRVAADRALAARPGYPAAMFNVAFARVLAGDAAGSLDTLQTLLAQHIEFGVGELPEFAPLKALPEWEAYAGGVADLQAPFGEAEIAWRHDVGDFIPEGIAVDPDARGAWLGSIRYGTIRRVGEGEGNAAAPGPHWSVFGMRLREGRLWFVSSAIEQFAARDPADAGRSGLFSVAVNDGPVRTEALLPPSDVPQALGDLEFGMDGVVYVSDQSGGGLYRFDPDAGELSEFMQTGPLRSPQGMALAADGQHLYVADYVGGLFRIVLKTGELQTVSADEATSVYGIDGLYRHGNSLIAIQNGIRPNRVVQFLLSADGSAVTGSRILAMNLAEFDEPNLGQVVGDDFYFIANSHWNRFDAEGNLPSDLDGPVVLRVEVGAPP